MRLLFWAVLSQCLAAIQAQTAWINEFHYDNQGSDVNEFIEIAYNTDDTNLDGWKLLLYNGNDGQVYETVNLSNNGTATGMGVSLLVVEVNGIQNGSPDGMALVNNQGLVESFLSYEGSFVATDGAANGTMSVDIGVSESDGSTPTDASLQLSGTGCDATAFVWRAAMVHTKGAINTNQIFNCTAVLPSPSPTLLPTKSPSDVSSKTTIAWINEFHYDNDGTDSGEFVEIAYEGDLAGWTLYLLNGNTGTAYKTFNLTASLEDGISLLVLDVDGIQNGPDALALVDNNNAVVVEFISYEGTVTASSSGPLSGMTSIDIGVSESDSTPVGFSLQRAGTGCVASSFVWRTPLAATKGTVNLGQSFDCDGTAPTPAPVTLAWVNEIHYDNESDDAGESVEIAYLAGTDLSGWQLILYDGGDGSTYGDAINLSSSGVDTGAGVFLLLIEFPTNGLQNGPDGFALVDNTGSVVQFLSYEGTFTATEGPAFGLESTDIGAFESGFTDVGQSLQLRGVGCSPSDFIWEPPRPSTSRAVNTYQCFDCGSGLVCATPVPAACAVPTGGCTRIEEIQGEGNESPLQDQAVVLCGAFITFVQHNGFWIQHGDQLKPGLASSAVFVYTADIHPTVSRDFMAGEYVVVCGMVTEFGDLTEIVISNYAIVAADGISFPEPVRLTLPTNLEPYEGMLVNVDTADSDSKMVVSELFELDRFGRFVACLTSDTDGRLFQYTQVNTPDKTGYADYRAELESKCIYVDDGDFQGQNPMPVRAGGYVTIDNPAALFRTGSEVTTLKGLLYQIAFSRASFSYGVQPLQPPDIAINTLDNPRPEVPSLTRGPINITSTNLLNFFLDFSGRGADNQIEFDRQLEKLKTALTSLNTDIFGVIELENTDEAVKFLLNELNTALPDRSYNAASLLTDETSGTDLIRCDIFFDQTVFTFLGASTLDDSDQAAKSIITETGDSSIFNEPSTNRVPIAVSLRHDSTLTEITVVAIHLKSKGGSGSGGNRDRRDGAGNYNERRLNGIKALLQWLTSNPTGMDVSSRPIVLLGDFNAYAKEDPIVQVLSNGFTSVEDLAPPTYSYVFSGVFGTLDYIFMSNAYANLVQEHATWHCNSDEPDYFDYNTEFRGDNDPWNPFDGSLPYRYSDHDPLVISFGPTNGNFTPLSSSTTSIAALSITVASSLVLGSLLLGHILW